MESYPKTQGASDPRQNYAPERKVFHFAKGFAKTAPLPGKKMPEK